MSNLEFMLSLEKVEILAHTMRLIFITLFSYYAFIKIINININNAKNISVILVSSIIIAIIEKFVQNYVNVYLGTVVLLFLMTLTNGVNFKKDLGYSLVITIISYSISYILYMVSLIIAFIPGAVFKIQNDYLNLLVIVVIYSLLTYIFFKIKKFKNGIAFLQKKLQNSYFCILTLNIGVMVLFSSVMMHNVGLLGSTQVVVSLIILVTMMTITIKQSFELYYKQNLLTKDLDQTKSELEFTKKELEQANKDNLEISEKIHTLNHRQKSLQHQLDKISNKDGKSMEYIQNQLNSISEEMYQEPEEVELAKTDIPAVDNMLEYMQSECKENNIKFELQVIDNIHYMVNNLIPESKLEILLADHIKDAIIAINYSENSNRSILARLGKIDGFYSLYIYDSGIEFTQEVLEKLGKEPITTHKDSGGTGMGFMNTFNTLNETKASLVIKEIGEPTIDNYTKVVIIRFDNKNEFKVESYKKELEYSN